MYIDLTYIIMALPAVIVSLWAIKKVKTTYQQYRTQYYFRILTRTQYARFVLNRHGLSYIQVEQTYGMLTDYEPLANATCLSYGVYGSAFSVAVGAAYTEGGHSARNQLYNYKIENRHRLRNEYRFKACYPIHKACPFWYIQLELRSYV